MNTNSIIAAMKDMVRWEMDWTKSKQNSPDNENIMAKPDKEIMFEKEVALAILLMADVVFLNSHWWMGKKHVDVGEEAWPEAACKMSSLNVNTSDVLAWGCADACSIDYDEIQEVYEYWEKDPIWGTAIWYCKKLNVMPQKPVTDAIRKQGIWDIDNMGLN